MPYRLRLLNDGNLLVASAVETPYEAGNSMGRYPVSEFKLDPSEGGEESAIRFELMFRDEDGSERASTPEEHNQFFAGYLLQRSGGAAMAGAPPCMRCGAEQTDHERIHPLRFADGGLIYFSCWNDEEREEAA